MCVASRMLLKYQMSSVVRSLGFKAFKTPTPRSPHLGWTNVGREYWRAESGLISSSGLVEGNAWKIPLTIPKASYHLSTKQCFVDSIEGPTLSYLFYFPCKIGAAVFLDYSPTCALNLPSGILAFPNPLLCWLSTSTTGILPRSCCHHHNLALPVSFCEINMAAKQDRLWLFLVPFPRFVAWSI
jgi:hypothetical protein